MVFSSSVFLYVFLPLLLGLYYVSPRATRSFGLALASYVFYGWWRPEFVLLMLASTLVDYSCGRGIARAQDRGLTGKRFLVMSCLVNLSLLGWFKYANFGVDSFNAILRQLGMQELGWTNVILPVGISFYTFQTMSYTIDVYRRQAQPVKRFVDFMCYVALFPQLIAGPIVRYRSIAEQLRSRTHTLDKFYQGVLFFQVGFAKKILLADTIAGVVDQAFAGVPGGPLAAWTGTLAFSLQVYFDFSGYSDMAQGLGLMLGFRLPINFDRPFRSRSTTELWRRWHISLSTWLRDYLYVPLGGNRKGPARTYFNLMLTMTLGGLWHGAEWTFVIWGAYNGLLLSAERLRGKRSLYEGLPLPLQSAVTFGLFMVGMALFRSDDMGHACAHLGAMFGAPAADGIALALRPLQVWALVIGSLVVWGLPTSQRLVARAHPAWCLLVQPLFILAIVHLHYQSHVPFLYYRF